VGAKNQKQAQHDDAHAHHADVWAEDLAVKTDLPRRKQVDQRLQTPVGRRQEDGGQNHGIGHVVARQETPLQSLHILPLVENLTATVKLGKL